MKTWPLPPALPLLAIGLGVAGVTIALWLSRAYELVPCCRVFIDGCISISAAGRREPAVFVFRGTIIPMATLLTVVWWLNVAWLRASGIAGAAKRAALQVLGTLSPMLLIVYIALIGAPGDEVHTIRQLAIQTYFPAALLAKIILAGALLRQSPPALGRLLPWLMLIIALAVLVVAVASVVLAATLVDPSKAHNLMQWHATSAFAVWYLLLGVAWKRTRHEAGLVP